MSRIKTENFVTVDLFGPRNACWGEKQAGSRNPAGFFNDNGTRLLERYFVGFAAKNDHRKQLFVRMLVERNIEFKDNGADVQILASRITEEKIKEFLGLLGYWFDLGGCGGVGVLQSTSVSSESAESPKSPSDDLSDPPSVSVM